MPQGDEQEPPRRVRGRLRQAMTPDPPAAGAAVAPHDWRAARFMVIVAHPDDADFGPAATASRWIDAGSVGRLVCCTSGDQGGEVNVRFTASAIDAAPSDPIGAYEVWRQVPAALCP